MSSNDLPTLGFAKEPNALPELKAPNPPPIGFEGSVIAGLGATLAKPDAPKTGALAFAPSTEGAPNAGEEAGFDPETAGGIDVFSLSSPLAEVVMGFAEPNP